MKKAITAPQIFDGEMFHQDRAVLVDGEKICELVAVENVPAEFTLERFDQGTIAPGFVDWQVNGGGGVLFNNDTSLHGIKKIVAGHHRGGTTSLMPTLISDTLDTRQRAVTAVRDAIRGGEKSVLGLHLEGPHFAVERRGTHHQDFISEVSDNAIEWLSSLTDIKLLVTLAPEKTRPGQIQSLVESGVIVCAGHSDATAVEVGGALAEGLRGFTHLYNAMRPAAGREPGMVGSALLDRDSWCGIIVDGHHVHADMVRLAHIAKPSGKLCLVTDAMATVGSAQHSFELYGNVITEQDGCLINDEGRLAGSAISMIDAVRNCNQRVGLELAECLRMASLYPAEFLKLGDQLGKIKAGFRADMTLFDQGFEIMQTWVAGEAKLDVEI